MSGWENVFAPEPVPEWLLAFDAAPVQAVDALLGRRFYFGSLNAADPEELLVDWTLLLSGNGFAKRLDEALAIWVEENWGIFPEGVTAARLADTWSRLFSVVAYLEDLPRTAKALRDRFDVREDFLGPLSTGPSRDPLGRYLAAIARFQVDLSLAPFWWALCGLPDGVPFYHAPYAIAGLLGLPPLDESQAGGFREQVAYGVVRLASALLHRVETQEIQKARAKDEWLWATRLAMARLPFPARWRVIFEEAIHRGVPDDCRAWLKTVLPGLGSRPPRQRFDTHSWNDRAQTISRALRAGRAGAEDQARDLLREQEQYARHSGSSGLLVRSLNNFSKAIWARDPRLAVQWAELALTWEPWDAYSWTTLTQALRRAEGVEAALPRARETVERFPENVVARNGLAEVFKELDRLEEAEAVYRQAMADFPANAITRNGLAEVLKELGRLEEAEAIYRQAMADFPADPVARNGLAEVFKELGRLEEAEAVYRQAMADLPANVIARIGLAEVLKELGRLSEAEAVYRQAVAGFPANPVARTGLAEVLKELGRLDEAEAAYRQVVADFPANIFARTGLAEVLKGLGRLDEAEAVYRQAMADFPANAVAPVGLAAVLRLRGAELLSEALSLVDRVPDISLCYYAGWLENQRGYGVLPSDSRT